MKLTKRIELVTSLAESINGSLRRYESVESQGMSPNPGYNIDRNDSRGAIINRCRVARAELLEIIKDLEKA